MSINDMSPASNESRDKTHPGSDRAIVIVSGADRNYVMPMTVSLYSALSTLDPARSALVYIIADGISSEDRDRSLATLRGAHPKVTVEWLTPDTSKIHILPAGSWQSQATYLRLLIPTLLPDHIERVLYVDSDIVVRQDLSPLWSIDMEGYSLMAVENWAHPTLGLAMPQLMHLVDASPETPYLNAGILLMDLTRWREQSVSEKSMEFLLAHKEHIVWADQDALNAVLLGDWGQLEGGYNVQLSTIQYPEDISKRARLQHLDALRNPGILHYTGRRKPWQWQYSGLEGDAFLRAGVESGWFGFPQGRAWRTRLILSHMGYRGAAVLKRVARSGWPARSEGNSQHSGALR